MNIGVRVGRAGSTDQYRDAARGTEQAIQAMNMRDSEMRFTDKDR